MHNVWGHDLRPHTLHIKNSSIQTMNMKKHPVNVSIAKQRTKILLCAVLLALATNAGAQCLKGHVFDAKTHEPLISANVMVFKDGNQVYKGTTDFDGIFVIKPINLDSCDIKIEAIGYHTFEKNGIDVHKTGFTVVVAALEPMTTKLETITIKDSRYGQEEDSLLLTLWEYKIVDKDIKKLLDRVIDGKKCTYDYDAETFPIPRGATCDLYLFPTPSIDTTWDSVRGDYNYLYMLHRFYDTTLPYPIKKNAPLFSFDSMTTCVQVVTTYNPQTFVEAEGYVVYRGRYFFLRMPVDITNGYFRKTGHTKKFRQKDLPPCARRDSPTWIYTKQQGYWYRWMELPNGF